MVTFYPRFQPHFPERLGIYGGQIDMFKKTMIVRLHRARAFLVLAELAPHVHDTHVRPAVVALKGLV